MRTMILIAAVLGGCSLYSGDDEPIDPGVDAGVPAFSMTGTYRVTWTCVDCSAPNPLARDTQIDASTAGPEVRIGWSYVGALAPDAIHIGEAGDNGCARFPEGTDGGIERARYTLCMSPAGDGSVFGTMAWGTATLAVDLTPVR
jgi:hypothetical protein